MPYPRKLPSGKWQVTVKHPSGKRYTRTDPPKKVVMAWGLELEAQRVPAGGHLRVGREVHQLASEIARGHRMQTHVS